MVDTHGKYSLPPYQLKRKHEEDTDDKKKKIKPNVGEKRPYRPRRTVGPRGVPCPSNVFRIYDIGMNLDAVFADAMNAFNIESEASPLPAIALESAIEGILETGTQGPSAPSSNLTGQSQTTTISEWGVDLPMSELSQDNMFEGTGIVDDYDVFDDFLCAGETEDQDRGPCFY